MRRAVYSFIGKMKDLKDHLAAQVDREQGPDNVVYLRHCELCGRLAKGEICRRCEPMFRRWTKKAATEVAAKNSTDPTIA